MDAGRTAVLADPEGAVFCVWQASEHKGARIVNEPGSLNFNVLTTREPEAAKRFYGDVFGWTTLDLGSGEFWTLRAYGDYLETLTPGVRERTAELGAAGFEDVVAAITPIADDDPDSPLSGASPSRPMTPTRRRRRRRSSAAPWSPRRSTHRTREWPCSVTRRERRSRQPLSCPRTKTSAATGERVAVPHDGNRLDCGQTYQMTLPASCSAPGIAHTSSPRFSQSPR